MTAPHFLIPSLEGDRIELPGEASHHAIRVLRLKTGDQVSLTDGAGGWVSGRITDADPTATVLEVEQRRSEPRPHPRLTVAFALTKGHKPELAVEKLTELGADRIIAFAADRSVVSWDADKRAKNLERFRSIAAGAVEQSKRSWLPEILEPASDLGAVLEACSTDRILICEAGAEGLVEVSDEDVTLLIGPEGGFTDRELEAASAAGSQQVSISDAILRAETAAIAAAALAAASRLASR